MKPGLAKKLITLVYGLLLMTLAFVLVFKDTRPSPEKIQEKVLLLWAEFNHQDDRRPDSPALVKADRILTEALKARPEEASFLTSRVTVRLAQKRYEEAWADVKAKTALTGEPGPNQLGCLLMERLARPPEEYLACHRKVAESGRHRAATQPLDYALALALAGEAGQAAAILESLKNGSITPGEEFTSLSKAAGFEVGAIANEYLEMVELIKNDRPAFILGLFP